MKKSVLLLGLAAMVSALTGCSKDVDAGMSGNMDNVPAAQSGVLVASLPTDGETRLALGEDGLSTTWSKGDRIGLYSDAPANKLIAFDIMPENVGTSSATFVINNQDAAAWNDGSLLATSIPVSLGNQVIAIYPYEGALVESPMGDYSQMLRIGGTIPATQNYVENSFDPTAMPMIAMTTRTEGTMQDTFDPLKFVHMGALLKLQLTSPEAITLDKVVVSGSLIAGAAYVDFSSGLSQTVLDALQNGTSLGLPDGYFGATNYESTITVNGPIEVNPDGTTNVYIAVLANKYTSMGSSINFSFYKDGEETAFASRGTTLRDVKAGELVTIEPLSLGAGETPVLTIDGMTPTLVSWQELTDVKSLTLTLTQNEKVVYSGTLDSKATSVDIATLPLTSVVAQGEINFSLNVEYVSAFGASASTVMTLYSTIIPTPILSVDGNMVTIGNANAGYDMLLWSYLEGADKTDPNDFENFTTEGINNGVIDLSSLAAGDYSVCVRGMVGFEAVNTCVNVTVTEYTGPTYDVEISASMEGKVLTITVTKGADIVQKYIDAYNLSVLISGFEVGLYDGWTVDQQSISVDLTDNLNFGDIKEGVNTISLGAYPEGQWSASPISNEVSVNIE